LKIESGPRVTWQRSGLCCRIATPPFSRTVKGTGAYLTELSRVFAEVLGGLIGREAAQLMRFREIPSDGMEDVHTNPATI
jgi:hypothetical protein